MKILNIVKYLFTAIGLIFFIISFTMYQSNTAFLKNAVKTQGEVIEIIRSKTKKSNGEVSISTYPVVSFKDKVGKIITFTSSTGSSSSNYFVKQKIEVVYSPDNPEQAKINDFSSLWTGIVIFVILGALFFIFGLSIFIFMYSKAKTKKHLLSNGEKIETEFIKVDVNQFISVNNKNPYVIFTQWLNPKTSEIHIFKSDDIWFDPTNYINDNKIVVLMDKDNPKKYHVDTSFLPKVVN